MSSRKNTVCSIAFVAALFVSGSITAHAVDPPAVAVGERYVAARTKALNALIEEHWQTFLREAPEQASFFGDYRYNDGWSDFSMAAAARQERDIGKTLARFKTFDTTGLADADRLNHALMVRWLDADLRAYALKSHEMPLDQMNGMHLLLPILVKSFPYDNVKQYEDYVQRLHGIPKLLQQITERARQGARDGLMPPRYLLEKIVAQCEGIARPAGVENVFGAPAKKFPDDMSAADRARLTQAISAAVDEEVRPAYRQLAAFVAKEYAPQGREQAGVWSLPQGDAIYRYWVEQFASASMDPEQIHQLGVSEVARIEKAQADIAKNLGYADLETMRAQVKQDPKLHAKSRDQILGLYKKYVTQMESRLPELFGLLPKTRMEVMPIETYREKEASAASYMPGTPDGARPGMVMVNTGDFSNRLLMPIEAIAYHEGLPGHHLQLSIARTLPELPKFRQLLGQLAYIEGWGLYSERLGKELGFYEDPYSDFGRLSNELMRANRLVLDTGVHHKRWTREQMVAWYRAHSDTDEPSIQSEVDRYIAWPAQALAYKIGELKIIALREKAQKTLGDKFDIRDFHDQILGGGALPLSMLEQRIDAWIARTQVPGASAAAKDGS